MTVTFVVLEKIVQCLKDTTNTLAMSMCETLDLSVASRASGLLTQGSIGSQDIGVEQSVRGIHGGLLSSCLVWKCPRKCHELRRCQATQLL